MIQYGNAHEGLSLRTVSASTGHGRQKVTEILQLAKEKGLECPLTLEMVSESSSIAYSIIETARANNLNVFKHLTYLFK